MIFSMRKINASSAAEKFLRRVPPKHGRQLRGKILELASNPKPQDTKPLKGIPYLRADSGEYRIIYTFDDEMLYIYAVGKRNDDEAYRQLRRGS